MRFIDLGRVPHDNWLVLGRFPHPGALPVPGIQPEMDVAVGIWVWPAIQLCAVAHWLCERSFVRLPELLSEAFQP